MEVLVSIRQQVRRSAWESGRLIRRIGTARLLGVLVLAVSIFLMGVSRRLNTQVQGLSEQLRLAREQAIGKDLAPAFSADRSIEAFYGQLPSEREVSIQLQRLDGYAAKHGVILMRGDYKFQAVPGTRVIRCRISLPVQAAYPSVDGFLREALQGMPTLALDSVNFKRERSVGEKMDAMVNLVLIMRAGES